MDVLLSASGSCNKSLTKKTCTLEISYGIIVLSNRGTLYEYTMYLESKKWKPMD